MKTQILAVFMVLTFISCSEKKEKEDKPQEDKKEVVQKQQEKTEVEVISKEASQPVVELEQESENTEGKPFNILGKRSFSLQWIGWKKMGKVEFTDLGGAISVTGEQKSEEHKGDFVKIECSLISADEKELVMEGKITSKVYHLNNGEECVKEGRFVFKVTGKRKFWRLQDMKNACEDVTDYVDIYL